MNGMDIPTPIDQLTGLHYTVATFMTTYTIREALHDEPAGFYAYVVQTSKDCRVLIGWSLSINAIENRPPHVDLQAFARAVQMSVDLSGVTGWNLSIHASEQAPTSAL